MIGSNGVSVINGYRDRSSYDPYASPSYGRPLRPFNWVQWTGVAVAVAGIVFEIAYLASQAGWMRKFADTPTIGSSLGTLLTAFYLVLLFEVNTILMVGIGISLLLSPRL